MTFQRVALPPQPPSPTRRKRGEPEGLIPSAVLLRRIKWAGSPFSRSRAGLTGMAKKKISEVRERAAVAYGEGPHVPSTAWQLNGFRAWAQSDGFPKNGRIDYLAGDIDVDMSPEDLQTHGTVKTAIAAALFSHVSRPRRGFVFVDRTRVASCQPPGLSVEPNLVAVLFSSLDRGLVRQIPAAAKGPGRFVELEGAPDLVVEILSDSSVTKDSERLPPRGSGRRRAVAGRCPGIGSGARDPGARRVGLSSCRAGS